MVVLALATLLSDQVAGQAATTDPNDGRRNTSVFDCLPPAAEAFSFTVRRGPGELALWLPTSFGRPYLILSQDFAQTGAIFRESDVAVELGDGNAQLWVDAEHFGSCVENPARSVWEHAKLSGVDFRASGTNPDWHLEIRHGGNIDFVSAVSDAHLVAPTPEPDTNSTPGGSVYTVRTDSGELRVQIGIPSCRPADGGNITGASVSVTLAGLTFVGCGRPLH
jgi:uncharacterized membrane protein